MKKPSETLLHQYQELKSGGAVVETDRSLIRLRGADRNSFLHNFCTNEVKGLQPGSTCEAFILNTKGKILGHGFLLAFEDEILISAHGTTQSATMMEHLDLYKIREDVEMVDLNPEASSLFVCESEEAKKQIESCFEIELPAPNRSLRFQWKPDNEAHELSIAHIEIAGPGWLIVCPESAKADCLAAIGNHGIPAVEPEALEMVRIENGTPLFGIDFSDENLPQELARDEKAISFNKGCYLGQETVARIDALGQVNKEIRLMEFANDRAPDPGTVLKFSDDPGTTDAGTATSVTWSPARDTFVGLAMVKRKWLDRLNELTW